MTLRSLLVSGFIFLSLTISLAAQDCIGTQHSQQLTCSCGGMAQLTTCEGLGAACENATGPPTHCTQTCDFLNAGDCLNAKSPRVDWFELKPTLLPDPKLLVASCGVKGQISFAEWLKIKLNEHRRANLYIRNTKNAL